jgi:predicted DNA-binding ribbon-helix-helix protein
MARSRLLTRNVLGMNGRTSIRLEPELWDALDEMCRRGQKTVPDMVHRISLAAPGCARTSAVRVGLLSYFRKAATEAGHQAAGHGTLPPVSAPDQPEQRAVKTAGYGRRSAAQRAPQRR